MAVTARLFLTKRCRQRCPNLLFQCLLEEYFPDSEGFRVGSVMAVLAVIGGIDGRLRLGGQVIHEEYGEGTVTRITPKGRITVQFHEMRTCRVCLLSHLKPVCDLLHFMSAHRSINLFSLNRLNEGKYCPEFHFCFCHLLSCQQ